ncbi:MAG: Clp protease ClpP [Streptococcus thermophilus]|uniref:Clp protease-like protein n=3 Tax=Moineauvirus TaxID=1623304 RepID=A0A3G8F8C4_9CAUD|nr:scaffolding protein [Streptococcus phage 7A5]YP_010646269.1 Clp protease-like protein [Streptococcus phage CHPC950]YP_010646317.1 Clp protease-like protein [Streptococcus phage CHPC979]ATI19598.1 scaffolding protein [Streptococcus phage 9B4]ATI19676.1 scaffolding protein [Streptococcus phage 31B4]AZF91233.1 Clp protease-like protein [Streptococcus phage CHPC1014]MDU7499878.1 Clp protease ClpP [Streptococcus thermophilus]ATI19512.1 scaffolding protein [Streptococcus phage 7A5]
MGKIDIKGYIVSNDDREFYDFYGMTSTYPKMVQDAIANDEDEEITLNIASNGGDVFAASEIYTMLRDSGKRIVVNIQGLAASAASVISMAGNTVRISPTAHIMIHKASSGFVGNSDDMEHQSVVLNSIDESIALAYEMKTGLKQSELLELMAKETWLNAKTAVDKGFADEIMFFEEQIMVTNAVHQMPSKSAINKFKNMIAKPKTNSLREQKLKILLEK